MKNALTRTVAFALVALSAASPLRRENFREVKLAALRGGGLFGAPSPPPLDSDEDKALYALGCNVGRQVGDLDCFSSAEIDAAVRARDSCLESICLPP